MRRAYILAALPLMLACPAAGQKHRPRPIERLHPGDIAGGYAMVYPPASGLPDGLVAMDARMHPKTCQVDPETIRTIFSIMADAARVPVRRRIGAGGMFFHLVGRDGTNYDVSMSMPIDEAEVELGKGQAMLDTYRAYKVGEKRVAALNTALWRDCRPGVFPSHD